MSSKVLDLAAKCCEKGQYEWKEDTMATKLSNTKQHEMASAQKASPASTGTKIAPAVSFGEIFDKCRERSATRTNTNKQDKDNVWNDLFWWHVANLEMSSGVLIHKLGQNWNNDEAFVSMPFLFLVRVLFGFVSSVLVPNQAYGGDHSYLKGGLVSLPVSLIIYSH